MAYAMMWNFVCWGSGNDDEMSPYLWAAKLGWLAYHIQATYLEAMWLQWGKSEPNMYYYSAHNVYNDICPWGNRSLFFFCSCFIKCKWTRCVHMYWALNIDRLIRHWGSLRSIVTSAICSNFWVTLQLQCYQVVVVAHYHVTQ